MRDRCWGLPIYFPPHQICIPLVLWVENLQPLWRSFRPRNRTYWSDTSHPLWELINSWWFHRTTETRFCAQLMTPFLQSTKGQQKPFIEFRHIFVGLECQQMWRDIASHALNVKKWHDGVQSNFLWFKPLTYLRPLEKVAIDIVGPMTVPSWRGYRYILTFNYIYTHWPEAVSLHYITAEDVTEHWCWYSADWVF